MTRLRDAGVGVRLAASFGVLAVLLGVVVAAGVAALADQRRAQADLVADYEARGAVHQLEFGAADVDRWQNAYALQVVRRGTGGADDAAPFRKGYLDAQEAFRQKLRYAEAQGLDGEERRQLKAVRGGFQRFVALDARIVSLYRQGTPASTEEATDLVLVESQDVSQRITDDTKRLVDAVTEGTAAAAARAERASGRAGTFMLFAGVAALAASCLLAVIVTRSLTVPLRRMMRVLGSVAAGDLTPRVEQPSGGEVGRMEVALNESLDAMATTVETIAAGSSTLSSSSAELSAVSEQLSAASSETSAQAAGVSAAAEQVSHNLTSVAVGAEELGASVAEIARNTSAAAVKASRALALAEDRAEAVQAMGARSAEIGEVSRAITSIAEQTNLLALNATIEAARAGDAGRGFAVVAGEVKELARKAARSSEEIGQRIEGIQADSERALAAIAEIADVVREMSEIGTAIAAAVEEQSATTNEIGRSVAEAAAGSGEIARSITGVASGARSTMHGAAETHRSAQELARVAGELEGLVSRFHLGRRAFAPPARSHPNGSGAGGPVGATPTATAPPPR